MCNLPCNTKIRKFRAAVKCLQKFCVSRDVYLALFLMLVLLFLLFTDFFKKLSNNLSVLLKKCKYVSSF